MNLKYCHFTFPPSSPSLLLSDFPLSYLSSRHHHHHHHLLHKRSPTRSLSLSNTHPLRCTVICFSFPFFLSNPLSSPLPTKPGVSLLAHFSFVLAHHFTPTPLQTFPQRFPRSFSPPRTGAPPPPSPLHTLVSLTLVLTPFHDRCTWPHLQVSTERNRWRRQIEWKSEIAIRKGQK